MKAVAVVLAFATLNAAVRPAWSQETPVAASSQATSDETEYAARESEAQGLEAFTGGTHGLIIGLLVVAAIVVLVLWFMGVFHEEPPPGRPVGAAEDPEVPEPASKGSK